MNLKFSKMKRHGSTISSNQSSTSSSKINLRTILKPRGSQKNLLMEDNTQPLLLTRNQSQLSNNVQSRLSVSMKLETPSRLSQRSSASPSISRNTIRKLETLNCQEQLINKQQPKNRFTDIVQKLAELDRQAQQLIEKKIRKIAKKSNTITLRDKGRDQISTQIQNLISKINNLKSDHLQKFNVNQQEIKSFMDRKIKLLEKLMAETSIQSEVLKKYFFAINAINHQSRTSKRIRNQKRQIKPFLEPIKGKPERAQTQGKQSIYKQSLSKQLYNPPRADQYQTYRHKNKSYIANAQPLPRSSYKCQYLFYTPKTPERNFKTLDNHALFGKSKLQSSTYSKDYQTMKAQRINYRELDSYKNKLRNIQVSYASDNSNRMQQSQKYIQKSKRYIAEQLKMKYNTKNIKSIADKIGQVPKSVQNRISNSSFLSTQAKRQFKGYQHFYASIVKNRELNNLKYSYRNLINQ